MMKYRSTRGKATSADEGAREAVAPDQNGTELTTRARAVLADLPGEFLALAERTRNSLSNYTPSEVAAAMVARAHALLVRLPDADGVAWLAPLGEQERLAGHPVNPDEGTSAVVLRRLGLIRTDVHAYWWTDLGREVARLRAMEVGDGR